MTSWSFSAYSSASRCLKLHQYQFLDKIKPEGLDSGDLLFGSALHSAINATLTGEDGTATFEIFWLSYKDKEISYGRHKWAELAQLGAEFIRKFVKGHASKYSLEFAEKRLYATYKGVEFEGTPDFIGTYNGVFSLRDFKTSGRNYEREKAICASQLYLYAYLWHADRSAGARVLPVTLGYTVFNKGTGSIQDLTWEFKEKDMYEALDNMVAYTQIWNSAPKDKPKNYGACLDYNRKCGYFDLCHGKEVANG